MTPTKLLTPRLVAWMRRTCFRAVLVASIASTVAEVSVAGDVPDASADDSYAGKSASWWVGELAKPRTQVVALHALQVIGAPALSPLLEAVVTGDAGTRRAALVAIEAIPGDPKGLEAPLLRAIESQSTEALGAALHLLSRSGKWPHSVLEALARHANDPVPEIRSRVLAAFSQMGTSAAPVSVPVLVAALDSADSRTRGIALEAIRRLGPSASAAGPAIVAALDRMPASEGPALVRTLGLLGPRSPGVLEALRKLIAHESGLRLTAADALAALALQGPEAIPDFVALFDDKEPSIRRQAMSRAAEAPELARASSQALVLALVDQDATQRMAAVAVLASLGPFLDRHLPLAIESFAAHRDTSRLPDLLGRLDEWAVPTLALAYATAPAELHPAIVTYLNRWPSRSLVPVASKIVPALASDLSLPTTRQVEGEAIEALLGNLAQDVPLALEALLSSLETGELGSGAAQALQRNQTVARGPLIDLAANKDPDVRRRALDILLKMSLSPAEWDVLARRLEDEDPGVRKLAAFGLMRVAAIPEPERALERNQPRIDREKLVRVLAEVAREGRDVSQRWDAMRCLGQLGAPAKPVLPLLVQALSDEDRRVVDAAADAVGKIARAIDVPLEDALGTAAESTEPYTRAGAALALAKFGGRSRDALRLLPPLRPADPVRVQIAILEVATALGPDAGVYLAPAMALRDSKDQGVANAAVRASDAIRVQPK